MKIYRILFIFTLALFLFFRLPYRSYVYANDIFDFFIADSAPNFYAVFLFVFLKKGQKNALYRKKIKKQHHNIFLALSALLAFITYEFTIQIYAYPGARIDKYDVLASFIAFILVYFLCERIDGKIALKKNIS
ncbi:hypothetical protein [Maribacter sp. 2307ULW6-5]|uniref:hypothetical protein n=1 Tax=Maribacter sp. 2307ULW6-5 TaxID=3386275 RepID=UPI0039BD8B7E